MWTTGFLPNEASNLYRVNPKRSAEKSEISEKIENMHIANSSEDSKNLREEDDLWLIGTSEVPLVSQHIDEVLDADQLPLRYFGFSSCYRREA